MESSVQEHRSAVTVEINIQLQQKNVSTTNSKPKLSLYKPEKKSAMLKPKGKQHSSMSHLKLALPI